MGRTVSSRSGVLQASERGSGACSPQDGAGTGARSKDIVECFVVYSTEPWEFARNNWHGRIGSDGFDGILRRGLRRTADIESDLVWNIVIIARMRIERCGMWMMGSRRNAVGGRSTGMARSSSVRIVGIVLSKGRRCSTRFAITLNTGVRLVGVERRRL